MIRTLAILAVSTGTLTAISAPAFAQESPVTCQGEVLPFDAGTFRCGDNSSAIAPATTAVGSSAAATNTAATAVGNTSTASGSYTDQQVQYARAYAARGIAASAALPTAVPSAPGKTAVGLGTGYHDGESAVGLAVAHAFTSSFQVSGGVARVSGGKNVARIAVGFEF